MLVLSRKKSESIVIGDDIEVMVVEIRGDSVRIGIDAPKAITVHRREVYDAIRREQAGHASCQPPEDDQPLLDKMRDEYGNC